MSVTDRILSALTTVIRMNDKVEEMAGLMKEQQRGKGDLFNSLPPPVPSDPGMRNRIRGASP